MPIEPEYRKRWIEADQVFEIPDGACPHPIGTTDGSAEQCVRNGDCGCDEREKYIDSALKEGGWRMDKAFRALAQRLKDERVKMRDKKEACGYLPHSRGAARFDGMIEGIAKAIEFISQTPMDDKEP